MKKRSSYVTTGIVSLFLIFSILCLVILSLLSLGTSRSDYAMSEQSLNGTQNYYDACTTATKLCLQVEDLLYEAFETSSTDSEYYRKIQELSGEDFIWDSENRQIILEIPFSDMQSLLVCLNIFYPVSSDSLSPESASGHMSSTPLLSVSTWQTAITGSWNPDTTQHVYQGEHEHE